MSFFFFANRNTNFTLFSTKQVSYLANYLRSQKINIFMFKSLIAKMDSLCINYSVTVWYVVFTFALYSYCYLFLYILVMNYVREQQIRLVSKILSNHPNKHTIIRNSIISIKQNEFYNNWFYLGLIAILLHKYMHIYEFVYPKYKDYSQFLVLI